MLDDDFFMREALKAAQQAAQAGEIPVGAVIVCEGRIVARGHNDTERLLDVTAHAEMIALTAACNHLGSKYLPDCTLYVTLEPCPMCAGALSWAQLGRLVYGAADDKRGFMRFGKAMLHPKTRVLEGVLGEPCGVLIRDFFAKLRL
ncbi:MAG: nucleoside deaminase [Saprospiraceae bacterium]